MYSRKSPTVSSNYFFNARICNWSFPFFKSSTLCDVAVLRLEVSTLLDWSLFVVFLFYWDHEGQG